MAAPPGEPREEKPQLGIVRSALFVPAARPEMIERARDLDADALVLDLEDSVSPESKEQARSNAREALPALARPGRQLWMRVNNTYSLLTKDDIRAVVGPDLDGIMLPKADRPEQVYYLEALLRDAEPAAGIQPGTTKLILVIESAAGLLATVETARASRRAVALQFGAEDYCADLGMERTPEGAELVYARGAIAVAAAAAKLPALDTVYPVLHDEAGLLREARLARSLGFRGKFAIHPEQIGPINTVFTPAADEVERARRLIAAYDEAAAQGRGAVQVDGAMVDAPVAARARNLLARAESIAARTAGSESAQASPT